MICLNRTNFKDLTIESFPSPLFLRRKMNHNISSRTLADDVGILLGCIMIANKYRDMERSGMEDVECFQARVILNPLPTS